MNNPAALILGALLTVSLPFPVGATEIVNLSRVRIEGNVLVVDYGKNFDACVHLLRSDYQLTHVQNFFCQSGVHVEIEAPLSGFTGIEQGTQVMLCHGNDYGICSAAVAVDGDGAGLTPPSAILSLGDINGDGSQDIAVLPPGTTTAMVKDAASGALIQMVAFSDSTVPNKFITVPDLNGNGAPELLVLGNGVPQTELRDSLSGALLSTVGFNANFDFVDVAVMPDQDGSNAAELALLGKWTGSGRVKVETRDALGGNLVANTFFSYGCGPAGVLMLPDVDGNGVPEFAVLCVSTAQVKVEIRDIHGILLRNIGLDKTADYLQMVLLPDMNGNGSPDLALLRSKPAQQSLHVLIVDALTGSALNKVPLNARFTPLTLAVVPDMNGNGRVELALLGHNPDTGASKVQLRDAATGVLVNELWFDKTYLPQDLAVIPDMNGNAVAELGMLGVRDSDGARRVFIRDARSGMQLNVVAFDDATARAKMVSAGFAHSCALRNDGFVGCWGDNDSGESTPPAGSFSQVSAAFHYTCGVRIDGTVACWGEGQPPYGEAIPPAGSFSQVSAGQHHACGVRIDGSAACWGYNNEGQSTAPAGSFSQVSAGGFHSCGLRTDGSLACWGNNYWGQSTAPAGSFSQVSAGSLHTCGLRIDGSVACWGLDYWGQSTPPAGSFSQVSTGSSHTCGVRIDGSSVACWGFNGSGQSTAPAGSFSQVSTGSSHTCGVRIDGSVACWGDNGSGQSTPPPGW